jgi:hypothetical protein
MRIPYNFVLIEPIKADNEIFIGDKKFILDNEYLELQNITVVGKVLAVPDELIFDRMDFNHSIEWKTPMDLQVGDTVWCTYMSIKNSMNGNDPKLINGNPVIPYQSCIVAKRNDSVVCLNGFILVEPIKRGDLSGLLPSYISDSPNLNVGYIRHIGIRNAEYWDNSFDDDIFSVGDLVCFENVNNLPLEYETQRFFGNTELFRMQRRDLICKIINN